jgi:hypothetical protein
MIFVPLCQRKRKESCCFQNSSLFHGYTGDLTNTGERGMHEKSLQIEKSPDFPAVIRNGYPDWEKQAQFNVNFIL